MLSHMERGISLSGASLEDNPASWAPASSVSLLPALTSGCPARAQLHLGGKYVIKVTPLCEDPRTSLDLAWHDSMGFGPAEVFKIT